MYLTEINIMDQIKQKVVCVDNIEYVILEIGKVYSIYSFPSYFNSKLEKIEKYLITIKGRSEFYPKSLFITIEEYREKQLNKII